MKATWCDQSVCSRIQREFIAIRLMRGRNDKSLQRIHVPIYPTTLVGIPEGKIIGQRGGYQPPANLHQLLSEATAGVPYRTSPDLQ